MNYLAMARQECANWLTDNKCLGCDIGDDLELRRFRAEGKSCALAMGEACRYFTLNVLPIADLTEDKFKAREFQEAKFEYLRRFSEEGLCKTRLCSCGQAMGKGERMCEACRQNRRKKTLKDAATRQRRKLKDASSTVV